MRGLAIALMHWVVRVPFRYVVQRLHQIVVLLPGKARRFRRDRLVAFGPVARCAGLVSLLLSSLIASPTPRSWPRTPRRQRRARGRAQYRFASVLCSWRSSLPRIARVIGSKVRHVLVAQGRSDTSHGGMLAGARLVVLQGLDDIGLPVARRSSGPGRPPDKPCGSRRCRDIPRTSVLALCHAPGRRRPRRWRGKQESALQRSCAKRSYAFHHGSFASSKLAIGIRCIKANTPARTPATRLRPRTASTRMRPGTRTGRPA